MDNLFYLNKCTHASKLKKNITGMKGIGMDNAMNEGEGTRITSQSCSLLVFVAVCVVGSVWGKCGY